MVHLYVEYLDVDLVEGDRPQHLQLGALDVEGEVVDGGVVQGQEAGVHGEALGAGCGLAVGAACISKLFCFTVAGLGKKVSEIHPYLKSSTVCRYICMSVCIVSVS